LTRKILLIAAGGTAMTLLNLKPSTIDIDFTGPKDDINLFKEITSKVPHGLKLDTYYDGQIYSQTLPDDYMDRSISFQGPNELSQIDLRSLHPLDIVVTKAGRLNERDKEDIIQCIDVWKLKKDEIEKRGEFASRRYPGNEQVYRLNLNWIISISS
jgi:hypothetical protein